MYRVGYSMLAAFGCNGKIAHREKRGVGGRSRGSGGGGGSRRDSFSSLDIFWRCSRLSEPHCHPYPYIKGYRKEHRIQTAMKYPLLAIRAFPADLPHLPRHTLVAIPVSALWCSSEISASWIHTSACSSSISWGQRTTRVM